MPLALDECNDPRDDFYKNMFAKCPSGRPGTADEVANVAELLMSDKGGGITGSAFLIDGALRQLFLWPAETGNGGLTEKMGGSTDAPPYFAVLGCRKNKMIRTHSHKRI